MEIHKKNVNGTGESEQPQKTPLIGLPITESILKDFVEVVRDVYGCTKLPESFIKREVMGDKVGYKDTRYGIYLNPKDLDWYDPSDSWSTPPGTVPRCKDSVLFYSLNCTGSSLTNGVWRGHYITDIMDGIEEFRDKPEELGKKAPKDWLLTQVRHAIEVVKCAEKNGRSCTF